MTFSTRNLRIKAKTWTKDTYGLYDNETTDFHSQNFEIFNPSKIIRADDELNLHAPSSTQTNASSIETIENIDPLEPLATISECLGFKINFLFWLIFV